MMLHAVTFKQVSFVEGQPLLLAEASELGLRPGEWPEFICVLNEKQEGLLFQKRYKSQADGWCYQTKDGRFRLEVLND